jgi:Nucleotidyl transferase AbiEii toxin, Type IV TA system
MPDLTDFQLEVTRLFFSLPASKGFLLAGGAALLAQHLTTRPTEDLDFFTAPDRGKDVLLARAAQIDAGFDTATLASMIATLDRFADD